MKKQELINKLEGMRNNTMMRSEPNFHSLYADGVASASSDAIELVKQLDEPKKSIVKQFVAEWFEEHKCDLSNSLWEFTVGLNDKTKKPGTRFNEFEKWFLDHPRPYETIIRMQDGYEIEKEPLYVVIIGDLYLIKEFNNSNDFYFDTNCSLCAWEKSAYQLTEAEIKAIDERYWPFAVPVEEVVEE